MEFYSLAGVSGPFFSDAFHNIQAVGERLAAIVKSSINKLLNKTLRNSYHENRHVDKTDFVVTVLLYYYCVHVFYILFYFFFN